jgi:hypothetical protein
MVGPGYYKTRVREAHALYRNDSESKQCHAEVYNDRPALPGEMLTSYVMIVST